MNLGSLTRILFATTLAASAGCKSNDVYAPCIVIGEEHRDPAFSIRVKDGNCEISR